MLLVVLTEPPYEVTEFGWGEFETRIQIHFHDASEKPVDIIHMLVLYPPGNQPASTKKVRVRTCRVCGIVIRSVLRALRSDDVYIVNAL